MKPDKPLPPRKDRLDRDRAESTLDRLLQITKLGISLSIISYSAPAIAGNCTLNPGSANLPIKTYLESETHYANSNPTAQNILNTESVTDALANDWRAAVLPQTSSSASMTTGTIANDQTNLFTINGVSVGVAFVNVTAGGDCAGIVNTGAAPELKNLALLQGRAPRPSSLTGTSTSYWDEGGGGTTSRNGVLFTFSQPVSAFGAWFGDLETRSDANGTPAILRLLDPAGNRIGNDISITPNKISSNGGNFTNLNQSTCSSTANGCGNNSTRWVGFVDSTARVKQALVIVGDQTTAAPTGGNGEHLSFIGANLIPANITGTVFEDVNYGGGVGRPLGTPGTSPRAGARVELYDSSGFKAATTTNSNGVYTFGYTNVSGGIVPGNYTVRVVNNTVTSSRPGYVNTLIPVQTFRTNGLTNNIGTADLNRVGGEAPQQADAANTSLTGAQSISQITIGTAGASGVDFGYNFDTIVNTNNAGQGSIRQFILNSNALTGESNLAQLNQPAGFETSIFMIPNGVANPGQNTSYPNQLNSNGIAVINLATALNTISGTKTRLDGATQTTNVKATPSGAETNSGQLGTGGKVGVNQTDLPKFDRPEIEIKGKFTLASTGSENQIKNIAFNANRLLVSGSNSLVQDNLVGMQADGTVTATTAEVASHGLELGAGNNIIVRHNYVKVNESGIRRNATSTGLLIESNEVDLPTGGQTNTFDGILLIGSGTNDIIRNNLVKNQEGGGIEVGFNGGTLTNTLIENNTVFRNGYDGASPSTETMGVAAYWLSATSTVTFRKNIITQNSGPGVVVMLATGVKLEQNSIFANGTTTNGTGLSIDLDPNTRSPNSYVTAEGVTPNNGLVSSSLPNQGMDYPIFTKAQRVGNNLKLAGYIGTSLTGNAAFTNATIEIYKADNTDNNQNGEVIIGDTLSKPHGEGRYYIGTITAGTNGLFDTTLAIPSSLTDGPNTTTLVATDKITAIATNTSNSTSEFSENIPFTGGNPNLLLVKRITGINSLTTTNGGDNLAIYQDETSNPYDDNVLTSPALIPPDTDKWPILNGVPFIVGGTNGGLIKPQDSIEYTIYFLSTGDSEAKKVLFCDRVPDNTTFIPNTFNSVAADPLGLSTADRGIAIKLGTSPMQSYTNINDGDIARYYPPLSEPVNDFPKINCGGSNTNGAVVVNLGNVQNATAPGVPTSSYGFIRFRGQVK